MKRLWSTAVLVLAAALCLAAADASRPQAAPPQSPPATAEDADPEVAQVAPATTSPTEVKAIEDVEVVSASPDALSVRIDGEEKSFPLEGKVEAALRVVRPGDKVRLFYKDTDNNGEPDTVTGLVITDPTRFEIRDKAKRNDDAKKSAPATDDDTDRPPQR